MKLRFLLIVILMAGLMIYNCGVNEEINPVEEYENTDEETLLKVTPFRGNVTAIEPLDKESFSMVQTLRTDDKVIYELKGIRSFVLKTNYGIHLKYKGENISFTVEMKYEDGKLKTTRITELEGQRYVFFTFGTDVFDWYGNGLLRAADDGECKNDADCEDQYPDIRDHDLKCIGGTCVYVPMN